MPLKTIRKCATRGPGMLSDDNGRKSVNLCCRYVLIWLKAL